MNGARIDRADARINESSMLVTLVISLYFADIGCHCPVLYVVQNCGSKFSFAQLFDTNSYFNKHLLSLLVSEVGDRKLVKQNIFSSVLEI